MCQAFPFSKVHLCEKGPLCQVGKFRPKIMVFIDLGGGEKKNENKLIISEEKIPPSGMSSNEKFPAEGSGISFFNHWTHPQIIEKLSLNSKSELLRYACKK